MDTLCTTAAAERSPWAGALRRLDHIVPGCRALRVGIAGDLPSARRLLDAASEDMGVVPVTRDADVTIVACSSADRLAATAATCWRDGETHLPLTPFDGRAALVGPVVLPGLTACHDCLVLRRRVPSEWPDGRWAPTQPHDARAPWQDADLDVSIRLAVRMGVRALVGGDERAIGHVTGWTPYAFTMFTTGLCPALRCPTCSGVALTRGA